MVKTSYQSVLATISLASLIQAHASPDHDVPEILPRQNTGAVPRPALGSVPYGAIITNCAIPGTVALTFDDGPGPYTANLLDLLAASGSKATFFVLGNQAQNYPDLITRMIKEGHQVASHTYDHKSLESLNSAQRIAELTQTEAVLKNILGYWPTYMRPPYGFCYAGSGCLTDMGRMGYHVVDWNVDTKDYQNDSPALIQNAKNNWDAAFNSASAATSAFIPLTHDVHYNTVELLTPYMIRGLKAKGFRFATVGECLGDPAENWYRDPSSGGVLQNKVAQPIVAAAGAATTSSAATNSTSTITSASSASRSTSSSSAVVIQTAASFSGVLTNMTSTMSSATVTSSRTTTASSAAQTSSNGATPITVGVALYAMLAMLFMFIQI